MPDDTLIKRWSRIPAYGAGVIADRPAVHRVEKEARPLTAEARLRLRPVRSQPILDKLRNHLFEIEGEVLPQSPQGRAVRYTWVHVRFEGWNHAAARFERCSQNSS